MGEIACSFRSTAGAPRSRRSSAGGGLNSSADRARNRRKTGRWTACCASASRASSGTSPPTRRKSKKIEASRSACGLGASIQPWNRRVHSVSVPCHLRAM